MSILKSPQLKNAVVTDPNNPMFEPEEVVDQLRAMQNRIAGYVHLPHNNRQMQTIKRRASVNVEFAREAINAVGVSETVQHIVGNSPAELRAAESEIGRWTAVEAELRSMLAAVVAANTLRRERLGLAALQVYNVSRELVRQEDHSDLLPHVEAMSRIPKYNRRTNRAAAKKADATQPAEPAANPPKTA
jgi:hypothetical protein